MFLLASSAGKITFMQAGTSFWGGIKAIPVTIYDVIRYQNAASLLQLIHQAGIILFWVFIVVVLKLRRKVIRQRRLRVVAR